MHMIKNALKCLVRTKNKCNEAEKDTNREEAKRKNGLVKNAVEYRQNFECDINKERKRKKKSLNNNPIELLNITNHHTKHIPHLCTIQTK